MLRSAPGMRPRGHSRQRNGEGWTVSARGGRGVLWEGERGLAGCRAGIDEESDWGSHGLGVDGLRNCQGRGAAHANRFQDLAISRSRKVMNLKWIATHSIQCSCYWRLRILSDRLPDTSGWLGDAPLPRIRYCQRHMGIPRRHMSNRSPYMVTCTFICVIATYHQGCAILADARVACLTSSSSADPTHDMVSRSCPDCHPCIV